MAFADEARVFGPGIARGEQGMDLLTQSDVLASLDGK